MQDEHVSYADVILDGASPDLGPEIRHILSRHPRDSRLVYVGPYGHGTNGLVFRLQRAMPLWQVVCPDQQLRRQPLRMTTEKALELVKRCNRCCATEYEGRYVFGYDCPGGTHILVRKQEPQGKLRVGPWPSEVMGQFHNGD